MIDYAYALSSHYGEAAAELSCEMYDELAEYWETDVPAAEPANTATYSEVSKAMNGSMKQSPGGRLISSTAERLVKQAGADTTIKNAIRDGAYWAWIPNGDTCVFCMTLASRGWQKASKKVLKANHAEHIHANCDCTFAIAFNKADTEKYPFYHPEKYLEQYEANGGDIRAWRRQIYPDIAKARNARRRELYAESSSRIISRDLPFTQYGEKLYIPSGTEITNVTTIAGEGTNDVIGDINRLISTYGGEKSDWKKAGKVESDRFVIDVHWYEKNGKIKESQSA